MLKNEFEVIGEGHRHNGRLLEVGESLVLPPAVAARFPAIFKAKRSTPQKAERVARNSATAKNTED